MMAVYSKSEDQWVEVRLRLHALWWLWSPIRDLHGLVQHGQIKTWCDVRDCVGYAATFLSGIWYLLPAFFLLQTAMRPPWLSLSIALCLQPPAPTRNGQFLPMTAVASADPWSAFWVALDLAGLASVHHRKWPLATWKHLYGRRGLPISTASASNEWRGSF